MWISRHSWIFGALLAIATFIAYQPAWNGTALLDDRDHMITTPQLRSMQGLSDLWFAPHASRQYHPLLDTVFWIEDKLWGESVLGYHLATISFHVCSALLLWAILRRLKIPGAWLAATVFALHPVCVESVAWMVELKNTLSGFLFFACVFTYLEFDERRTAKTYLLVLLLFAMGILVKAIVAAFPVVMLIIFWWKRAKLDWRKDVLPLIPFFILGLVAGILTAWMERALSGAEGEEFEFSSVDRVLIAGRAFWFYLAKLFWPTSLSLIYPRWKIDATIWWQYLFPLAAIALIATAWLLRRLLPWLFAAVAIFTVLIAPLLGFFNVAFFRFSFVADHFQYLPSVGIIVPVCAGAAILSARLFGRQRTMFHAAGAILLIALTTATWRQAHVYQNAESCYTAVIERNPTSWEAHMNVGAELFKRGALDEATAHFQKILVLNPNYAPAAKRAYVSLGNVYLKRGQWDNAIAYLNKSLAVDSNYATAHTALGSALHRTGKLPEAIAHYEIALRLRPKSASVENNLAWMLATCADPFLRNGRRALSLAEAANDNSGDANPKILRTLAAAYAENGRFFDASAAARRALRLSRDQGETPFTRALVDEIARYESAEPYHEALD